MLHILVSKKVAHSGNALLRAKPKIAVKVLDAAGGSLNPAVVVSRQVPAV